MKGSIVRWVDDRGFGFIASDEVKGDVFAHISKFERGYRRPQVGDSVEFQIDLNSAKLAARSIFLVDVKPLRSSGRITSVVMSLTVLVALSFAIYIYAIKPIVSPAYQNMGFSCQAKKYCSQMLSCEEARFYLENCPNTEIDGDGDGIPCEMQWCH